MHERYGDSVFVIEDLTENARGARRTPDGKPVRIVRRRAFATACAATSSSSWNGSPTSRRESIQCAPSSEEDTGVALTALEVPPNASIERVASYGEEVQRISSSIPEYDHSLQLGFPSGGFGGIIAEPWSERERNTVEIQNSAARNSIGLAIVGGMSMGTLFRLFIVPAVYVLIAREHRETSTEPETEPAAAEPRPGE